MLDENINLSIKIRDKEDNSTHCLLILLLICYFLYYFMYCKNSKKEVDIEKYSILYFMFLELRFSPF